MSDFSARIQAILDTTQIPSQIAEIERTPIRLSRFTLDTSRLPNQIQGSLDRHHFTIRLDGIRMGNIDTQARRVGQSYAQALADGVRTQLSNGGIEASIARVTAQYEKLATSGHRSLSNIAADLQTLNYIQGELASQQADDVLVNRYAQLNEVLTRVRNNLIAVSAETKSLASQSQIDAFDNKVSAWMLNNTKATGQFGVSIDSIKARLSAMGANVPISELNALEEEFKQIISQAKAMGLVGDSFGTSITKSFKNISSYISIATVLRQSTEILKEMAQNVLEIDTAMTGLYRVTSLTDAQYKQLYSNMAQSAKDYGAELTTIIDSTTNWTKLGFEVNTAQRLAEVTTMYQQVADLDTKTAVNNLVTAYKGYEEQLLQLTNGDVVAAVEYVADIYNKLGNEFAVEASDIGAALNNSASVLEMAGNTIQQSSAMATGIIEVTQDASRAGSALRTLTMRLRGTTAEDLEAIGEDTEGLIEVTSKLQSTIKERTGVDLVDANGQLRSTFEIMKDLAAVWDDLDGNTQSNVLEVIAGKNRASDIAALLNNWEAVEEAVLSASEATGTARAEYDQFLDSLQAHLNRLETAWQKLSYSFMDVGLLKTGVDVLVGLLEVLDALVNTLGSAGTISVGAGLFAIFKNIGSIKTFISTLKTATTELGSFRAALSQGFSGISTFSKVATGIGVLTTAISIGFQFYEKYKAKQAELRQEIIATGTAAKEEANKIWSLYDAYNSNTQAKEDLTTVTDEFLDALGVERSEVEALAKDYGSLGAAIDKLTIASLESKLSEVTAGYGAAKDELIAAADENPGWFNDFGQLNFSTKGNDKKFADYLSELGYFSKSLYNTRADISSLSYAPDADVSTIEGIIEVYNRLIEMRDSLSDGVNEGKYTREELADSDLYKELNAEIGYVQETYGGLIDYINELNNLSAKLIYIKIADDSNVPETREEFDALKQSMIDAAVSSNQFAGSQAQIEAAIIDLLASMPEYSQFFEAIEEQVGSDGKPIYYSFPELIADDAGNKSDPIDKINKYREDVEYLQDVLEKLREGNLTPDEQADLIIAYPHLAGSEDLSAGIIDEINNLKGASGDAENAASGIMAIFDEMYSQIDPTDTDSIQQFNTFKSLILSLFDTAENGVSVFENLSDAISGITNASDLISDIQQEMAESGQISLGTLEKLSKEFGSNIGEYITFDDGKIIPKIDKIKEYYIAAIEEMELEDPDLESTLISALDTGFSSYKMYLDAFNNAMSEVESAYDILAKAQEEMKTGGLSNDTIRSISESLGDGESLSDYLIEENGVLSLNIEKWNERTQAIANAEIDAIKARMAELQEYISGYSDYTDDEVAHYEGDEEFERLQRARAEYEGLNGLLGVYNVAMANAANTTEEETTALERLSSALDNVSSVSDYLTFLESDDLSFVEALEKAVKLLEVMGEDYSLEDFFSFDDSGELIYNTQFLTDWIDTYIDDMVTAGDVSQEFADRMKAAAQAEAEQADSIEKLTDAMSKVEKVSNLVAKAQEEIEDSGRNSMDTIISLYEQFGEKANDMLKPSGDGGLIIDTDAVLQEMYAFIDECEQATPELKQLMKDAFAFELEEATFEDTVDEYVNKIKTLQDTLSTLRSDGKLSDSALYDLVKEFPELATETDNLEDAITNLIGSMNTDIVAEFEKQFGKIDSEEDREQLQAFMDIVLKLGEVVGNTQFAIDINAEVDGMQNLFTAMKESVSSTGLTAESIANLKKRYEELGSSFDPSQLFERTENGIHLNTKALRELESEYENLKKGAIEDTLDGLVDQYNELTRQIDDAGTSASTVELYAQRNDILKQIEETAELAAQYAGLTSAFYAWEQAQSLGEEGDMYDSLTGGLKDIKQLYQDGLIGTNKFRTAVQLMSNEDLSNATAAELLAAYEAGYPKMQRYFQDSSDGVLHFLHDVEDLNSEWVHMNEDGSWDINFGVGNDQEIADALGINVESVQAILRKLSDYGFDINLDSMYSDLETMQSKAEKAAAKLKELGATDVDFDFDVTNIARLDEQIEDAKDALKKFENADGTINLEMEGAAEAQYVLATLILQRQALENPLIFKVDANNIEGVVGETLRKLQTIKQQYNNLDLQASIGADTSSIQSEIDSTISSFTDEEIQILTKLGIDPAASIETINTAIAGITPELLMEVGIDESAVTAFTEADHDTTATVVYNVDGSQVNRYTPRTKYASVKYTASMYDWTPPTKYGTIYYTAKTTKPSGTTTTPAKNNNFTPVAMARGTAYAGGTSGNWGAKNSGTALGGELGEELVVRDGKYFTIGSDGAEFFKYKKNDIIFNHKQTEELFKNGKLSGADGRGKAFAEGTAFSSGSGTITGGGNVITNPSGGDSNSGGSDGDGEEEKESKIIDWIEIAIDRIERAIGKLGRIAQSAYKSLATRLRASDDEIKKVIEEINTQNQGYNRYMQQAESVNLSDDLKGKVRNGTIDITEYDSDTAELIDEYQSWYEKALDCADAIDELHETLASLYEEKFNNIAADFSNQLSLIEHRADMFNSNLDEIEARGYLGGSELYNELIATESMKVSKLNAKLAELTKAMSDAVNSGEVEVGSEAWYAMQAAINETKLAIQESELAVVEFNNALRDMEWQHFDYLQERISQITQEADFLIGLMGNSDLYDDHGQLSDTGMATMGLHGVNYNTYLAQAEKYAEEIKKLDKDLAKDPYNKDLIARREELLALQQDSITAAEAEKQAIVDMVQEGINLELSSLKELIDAYTDSLDSAKDLYDYQKKVKKQTAEVASLQKQLAAYQNDTSEENRARLQKLQVDLSDAMEDLEETQYDRYIKEQKRLLDDFYNDYETNLNKRLDDIDSLISDMIDMINLNSGDIASTITSECASVGYTVSNSMTSIWQTGGSAHTVVSAISGQLTTLNTVISGIATNVAAMVKAGDNVADDTVNTTTTTTATVPTNPPSSTVTAPTTPPPITTPTTDTTTTPDTTVEPEEEKKKKVKITKGTWHIRKGASTKYDIVGYAHEGDIFDYLESSGKWNAVTYKGQKRWINNGGSKIIEGYSKGGYVAELQKIAMQNGDDIVTVNTLKRGEAVLTPEQTVMLSRFANGNLSVLHDVLDMSKSMSRIVGQPVTDAGSEQYGAKYSIDKVEVVIEHVEDYDDLMQKFKQDGQFEKMIQAMSTDRLVGRSKFAKYRTLY